MLGTRTGGMEEKDQREEVLLSLDPEEPPPGLQVARSVSGVLESCWEGNLESKRESQLTRPSRSQYRALDRYG